MKQPIKIFALTSECLHNDVDAEKILKLFLSMGPDFRPKKFGHFQPLKRVYSDSSSDEIIEEFGHETLIWRSSKSFVHLMRGKSGDRYGAISIEISEDAIDSEKVAAFIESLVKCLRPDIMFVHRVSDLDVAEDDSGNMITRAADGYSFITSVRQLKKGLPGIYWGTVLGRPYSEMFAQQYLQAIPGFRVVPLEQGAFYIQLTSDINDCVNNRELYVEERRRVARYLGKKLFTNEFNSLAGIGGLLPAVFGSGHKMIPKFPLDY